jgi:sodium-dependent phosphate transporter
VGATVGVGIAFGGVGAVRWDGVAKIVMSWIVSPLLAALFACVLFLATKYGVLRAPDSHARLMKLYPLYVSVTFAVVIFFMLLSGAPALHLAKTDASGKRVIRFPAAVLGVTLPLSLLAYAAAWRAKSTVWFTRYVADIPLITEHAAAAKTTELTSVTSTTAAAEEERAPLVEGGSSGGAAAAGAAASAPSGTSALSRAAALAMSGVEQDVVTPSSEAAAEAHALATRYDPVTERLFSACQVFTASFASLAHGSNDVANAIAPLSVISSVWAHGGARVAATAATPAWCLAYGGLFIDLGLLLMGYKVMRNLGNNITYHSPSRGYCMELGALTTVLWASATARAPCVMRACVCWHACVRACLSNRALFVCFCAPAQGNAVSTTHCITGATVGVGLCTGSMRGVNWRMVAWTTCGWMLTLPAAALVSGVTFALIALSPKALSPEEAHPGMLWISPPPPLSPFAPPPMSFAPPPGR